MNHLRFASAAFAAPCLVAVGGVGSSSVSAADEGEVSASGGVAGAGCLETDENGDYKWFGVTPADAQNLADELNALVAEHPTDFAGTAYCSHHEGLVVFSAEPPDLVMDRVSAVAALHPGLSVTVTDVGASWPELEAAAVSAVEMPEYEGQIVGAAPDVTKGGIVIDVLGSGGQDSPWASAVAGQVAASVGLPVEARVVAEAPEFSTRTNDASPYYGGARLNYPDGYCSAGLPIRTGGVTRLLTAGHCTYGVFTNNGAQVGAMYTTSYPSNADIYGDFQLLGSSTYNYGSRVFNGDMSSNSSLEITGGFWGNGTVGQGICTSGATTAQICRYFATNWGRISDFGDGILVYPMVEMRHDSTGGSGYDSNGAQPGDSGGPCYWSNGSGGVIATGIVTGRILNSGGTYAYLCSQLRGVLSWNSGAVIP